MNVALSWISGWLLITPRQFGPTTRMLWARANAASSRWSRAPSAPSSWNPELITTAVGTPASAASATADSTLAAGTAMMARSTGAGRSAKDATAGTPSMTGSRGCTTWRSPVNPPARMLSRTARPIPCPSLRTPTTATLWGYSSGFSDRASARRSLASAAACPRVVVAVSSLTSTTSSAMRLLNVKPASVNTSSMAWFSSSTSATKVAMPRARAAAARCSRSRLPMPSPWLPSSTRKATSAVPGCALSAVATARILPPLSATRPRGWSRTRWSTYCVRGVPSDGEEPQPERCRRRRLDAVRGAGRRPAP